MDHVEARKQLIEKSYDREAERYVSASHMQSANLTRLLDLSGPFLLDSKPKRVLDVGCGLGSVVAAMQARGLFDVESYLGIDLSSGMIEIAEKSFGAGNIRFAVGDAETLDVGDGTIDLIISNSVYHWLNQPDLGMTPRKAFVEACRVLAPGGLFAASIAGVGTASRFLAVYHAVLKDAGLDAGPIVRDPIGAMQLHDVVGLVAAAGLSVVSAQLDYEPVTFRSARDYADAVRAYGFEVFMAPVPSERREAVWQALVDAFDTACGPSAYEHDQYMIYVIAEKRR